MTKIQVIQVDNDDPEILESWASVTEGKEEPSVRAVLVPDESWPWQVFVAGEKAVHGGPIAAQYETAITHALEAVAGIEHLEREEPGLWVVSGAVQGRDLVIAVSEVIEALSTEARGAKMA